MCPAKVIFKRNIQGQPWYQSQVVIEHNHAPDKSIIAPSVQLYMDHLVTGSVKKPSPSQIAEHLNVKFNREFHIPSLFHHIQQRYGLHHKTEALTIVKQLENSEFTFGCCEKDDIQVLDVYAKRDKFTEGVLFVDKFEVEGTIAFLISSYNKNGKMLIEAILMANSFEKIGKHLLDITCTTMFVDYQLVEFVPHAYITRTSLMQLCTSQ